MIESLESASNQLLPPRINPSSNSLTTDVDLLPVSQKPSRFEVSPARLSFDEHDIADDCNSLLFDDYFKKEDEDPFSPYDLLMRLHFPIKKSKARSKLEKFKNYWENYSFYAIWRKKFLEGHSCEERDLWKEVCYSFDYIELNFI